MKRLPHSRLASLFVPFLLLAGSGLVIGQEMPIPPPVPGLPELNVPPKIPSPDNPPPAAAETGSNGVPLPDPDPGPKLGTADEFIAPANQRGPRSGRHQAAPDIAGTWTGKGWGKVELRITAGNTFEGTYTDTFNQTPGTLQLEWSAKEQRFSGTWKEGEFGRFGDIAVRLADAGSVISGAYTTSDKSRINPGQPRLEDVYWMRAKAADQAAPSNPSKSKAGSNYQVAEEEVQELSRSLGRRKNIKELDRAALREEVRRAFEARQELLREEVAEFRHRLERLARLPDDREKNKDAIIDRRVEELLNPNLRWDAGGETPSGPSQQPSATREKPADPYTEDNNKATARIYRLQHATAETLIKTLQKLIAEDVDLSSDKYFSARLSTDARTNSLIVFGKPSDLKIIERLITALDQAPDVGGAPPKPGVFSTAPELGQGSPAKLRKGFSLLDQIQGTWLAMKQGSNGEIRPFKKSTFTLTFRDNKYEFREGAADPYSSGTFTVNPVFGKHNALDLTPTYLRQAGGPLHLSSPPEPHLEHAIMKFDIQGALTTCWGGNRTNDRPDEFTTAKDDGRLLMVYRRISTRPLTTDELKGLDFTKLQDVSSSPTDERLDEGKPVLEESKPLAPIEEVLPENKSTAADLQKLLGLELRAVTQDVVAKKPFKGGLQVVSLAKDGPAAKAGFRVEDIVVGAQVWEVLSIEHLQYALDHDNALQNAITSPAKSLTLHVIRNRESVRELFKATVPLPCPEGAPSTTGSIPEEPQPLEPILSPASGNPNVNSGADATPPIPPGTPLRP